MRADDVASLVSSTFPDLGNKDAIIEKLTTDGGIVELLHNAADGVSSRLNEAMLRMTKVMDPTLLESDIVDYNEKVEALLKNSEAARSQRDLKGAVDFLVRAQQLVDDMNEAIAEADKQQRDEYVFPLSVMEKLRKNREEFETPKVREPSPLSEAKRTFAGGSYELLYTNQTGGEFRFFHFSVPADINEPIWIGPPLAQQPMVVIAAQVFQEEPGLWHIRFRFPGAFGMY